MYYLSASGGCPLNIPKSARRATSIVSPVKDQAVNSICIDFDHQAAMAVLTTHPTVIIAQQIGKCFIGSSPFLNYV